MNLSTLLLVIFSFTLMPVLLGLICLISIEMQHTPVRLRPLKMKIDSLIDNIEGDTPVADAKSIPPLHAAFLANPNQDIATLMAMVHHADQVEQEETAPKHVATAVPPLVEYSMVHLEVEMYLGFTLTPVDGVLPLTRLQYKQLRQFCGFYFDEPQTPEQVFSRYGLALRIS